jgi:uncharacterized protein (DUF849 family)
MRPRLPVHLYGRPCDLDAVLEIADRHGIAVVEDNIWFDAGRSRLATNDDLLRRIHSLAQIHERPIMKPTRLRELLHLEPGDGRYGRPATA